MKNQGLKLVAENPATDISRIVNIARNPREDENLLIQRTFAERILRQEKVDGNFWHREQELADMIQDDHENEENRGITGYGIFSTDISHTGAALLALTCANLKAVLVIYQHDNDRLDSIEVLAGNQRFVQTNAAARESR